MSKKEPINYLAYIKTIFLSMLSALVCLIIIVIYASNQVINNPSYKDNETLLKQYIKDTVIIQNEDLEAEYPDNYLIDLHLGYLYKTIKEYNTAEQYYLKAVQKAPISIYKPKYELASFYIEIGKIAKAKKIIEALPEEPNTNLLKYQTSLYEKLGDYYTNQGLYYYAMENYEEANYYNGKLLNSKNTKRLKDKYFESAINIADICVEHSKVDNAIEYLGKALKIKPNDFNTQYKYALVNVNKNPELSYKYFSKLFKQDPTKINYIAYHELLDRLSDNYYEEGDLTKAKLYDYRAKSLLEYVSENLIYPKDIDFKIIDSTLYTSNGKSKVIIKYNLQNISHITIKRLDMDVVYKINGKEIETYTKKLITNENPLAVGEVAVDNTIIPKIMKKYKATDIPEITVEIYLYKSLDRKLCVYNDKIFKDKIKTKTPEHYIDNESYLRYFVHGIRNFNSSLKTFKNNL